MKSTVVVVTWRGREHITACLDALSGQDRPHRILVVDNASDDGSGDLARDHPTRPTVLRLPENTGYAGGIQAALEQCTTPYMAWLNDDAMPEPGWLSALEDALDADLTIGAASSKLVALDGRVQSVGIRLTPLGYGYDVTDGEIFGFCGGAALLRTSALRAVGGVPAEFFCYYEDTDTSYRLRGAGWRIVSVPKAEVRHVHGATARPGSTNFHRWNERNRLLMLLRCAPLTKAMVELVRFAVITALIPFRPDVPKAENYRIGLRLRVLGEVLARAPWAIGSRVGRRSGTRSPI
ncbi:glycosyltransferase family 2 protein [Kibdelosporangium lantanae]